MSLVRPLGALALLAALAACEETSTTPPAPARVNPTFVDREVKTRVSGFTYDPEAFFYARAACGASCPFPAYWFSDNRGFQKSLLEGSKVEITDGAGKVLVTSAATSVAAGTFELDVDPVAAPSFVATAGGKPAPYTGPQVDEAPAASYVRTRTYRPFVSEGNGNCAGQVGAALSDKGILQAIAKKLSATGTATAASDLLDGTQYKGVAVVWLSDAGDVPYYRPPARDSRTNANIGLVYQLDWRSPTDASVPAEVKALQSDRGFYVTDAENSPIGLTAVVLPADASSTNVTLTPVDTVVDAATARPWTHAPVTVGLKAGEVLFAPLKFKGNVMTLNELDILCPVPK